MIKRLLLCLLLCLITYFSSVNTLYAVEKERSNATIDMVLALDTSKTMDKSLKKNTDIKKIDEAKMLAKKLCMLCKLYNIRLSCLTFGGKNEVNKIFENQYLDTEQAFHAAVTSIQAISCESDYTDQPGAFEEARTLIESADTPNKYIVMLSDGTIDYENTGDENRELTDPEKKAVISFQESCMAFTAEENQGAFLIGFGNDVDMFSDIENKKNELFYLRWDDDINTVFRSIFEALDCQINVKEKDALWINELEFDLEDNLYAASIYLAREGAGNVKSLTENDFSVIMKDSDGSSYKISYETFCLQNSAYLFFKYPRGGKYFLNLPEDKWKYDVYSLKNHRINDVNIMLYNNLSEISSKGAIIEDSQDISVYFLDTMDSDLNIQVKVQGNDPKRKYSDKSCGIKKYERGKESEAQWSTKDITPSSAGYAWSYKLKENELLQETYYQVRVGNEKGYVYSNIIKTVYSEDIKTIDIFTDTEISISEVFSELDEYEVYNRILLLDGKEVKESDENETYKYNDKKLTFFKKGNYTVELKGSIKKKLEVVEKEKEKISKLEKFLNCIKNFFSAIDNALKSFFMGK